MISTVGVEFVGNPHAWVSLLLYVFGLTSRWALFRAIARDVASEEERIRVYLRLFDQGLELHVATLGLCLYTYATWIHLTPPAWASAEDLVRYISYSLLSLGFWIFWRRCFASTSSLAAVLSSIHGALSFAVLANRLS
jgi:hypothetical protein